VKLAVCTAPILFLAGCLLGPAASSAQTISDCSRIITPAEKRKNGWISFRGQATAIDLANGVVGIEMSGKPYLLYFTVDTLICNRGKPGTLRDLKIGDWIGGMTKLVHGKSVAVTLGFGAASEAYPYGIPVPGKKGWLKSPYAPSKPPINVERVPYGGLVKCPYTGKLFLNPAP